MEEEGVQLVKKRQKPSNQMEMECDVDSLVDCGFPLPVSNKDIPQKQEWERNSP